MDNQRTVNPDCFVCRKSIDNSKDVNRFNLRQLFRHLNIKMKLKQNSVVCCSDCTKLSSQLCHQIVQLEVTQMKINYSMKQLVSKMGTQSNRKVNDIHYLVKEKCSSQLSNARYPQIKLKRLSKVHIGITSLEDEVISPVSLPPSPASPSPLSPESEETCIKEEINDDQSSKILKSKTRKRLPEVPKACRFCPRILNNYRVSQYHEVIFHPDKLLTEAKLDTTSDSKFLEICRDVLTRHKITNNRHGCLYCEIFYTNLKCLKRHLIESHLSNTLEKVRQLQQIDTKHATRENGLEKDLACQYCNKGFKNGNDLKNHKTNSCEILGELVVIKTENKPEYPKFDVSVKALPGQEFPCQFCPKTFQAKQMLLIHSYNHHYLEYLNQAKLESVSNQHFELYCQDLFERHYSRQKEKTRRQCVYCEKSFPHFQNYKSHLLEKHIDILYDKLKELQKEPPKIKTYYDEKGTKVSKRACQNCGKWILRQHLSTHLKYHCLEKKDRGFCKQCKCFKRFYSVEDLNSHCCPGSRKIQTPTKRVQCDKCGTQLNFYRLKEHQLKYCGKSRKKKYAQRSKKNDE